jgi:eukaryotic-like serine/threonine-protein kinase
MKRLLLGLFALAIAGLLSQEAFAQRGQGRGFGGGFGAGNLMLLNQKSVQEELKLSPEQVKKFEEQSEKQREEFGGLRDLSPEERRTKLQEQVKATDVAVKAALDENQLKRLKQISLQQRGAASLGDTEVADAVGLSSEQKDKVQSIQRAAFEEQRAQFQGGGGGGDGEERRRKFQEARTATNEKLLAVLTPEQKEKFKTLGGEPFKGQIEPPRRRGNRPGGL